MGKRGTVCANGKEYQYILTVLDVFSRFVWLRPLPGKSSDVIAKELKKIYVEHGTPRVLQCDQGTQLKGVVTSL